MSAGGWRWSADRERVLSRDGNRCAWCDRPYRLTVDHKIETRHGGTDHPSNLLTLCQPCHQLKTAATDQAAAELVTRHYAEFEVIRDRHLTAAGIGTRRPAW